MVPSLGRAIPLLALTLFFCPEAAAAQCTPLALEFSARTGVWRVADTACEKFIDFDVNGRPTLFIDKAVKVTVLITEINPFAHIAAYGEVTVADIEVIKDLQSLLLAAGGLARTAINPNAADDPAGPPTRNRNRTLLAAFEALTDAMRTFDKERDAVIRSALQLELAGPTALTVPSRRLGEWTSLFDTLRQEYESELRSRRSLATLEGSRADIPDEPARKAEKDALTKKVEAARLTLASDTLLAEAEKVLKLQATVLKSVVSVLHALRPLCGGAGCQPSQSVTVRPVIRMADIERGSAWDKIATHPIKIIKGGALSEDVVTSLPKEISTHIRIASPQAALLHAGVGIITSTISSPVWAAVANPAAPSQKVVTRTGDDKFKAVPALIGTYAFNQKNARRPSRPMLEFGASLQPDKPAWILGFGVSLGGGLRLGAGGVLARVKALDGQVENTTVVADKDAIKTRGAWNGGVYLSFGLSLSSLKLFDKE